MNGERPDDSIANAGHRGAKAQPEFASLNFQMTPPLMPNVETNLVHKRMLVQHRDSGTGPRVHTDF